MFYVDDSQAVSPMSEENNVNGCMTDSLWGMASVAKQVELIGNQKTCFGRINWLGSGDPDAPINLRSRQNSYWL